MLGDFINFTKGFAFKSSSFTSKGIKIVKVGNLNSNMSESSDWYYIDESEFEAYQKYQIKDDDVIVSTVGSWENNPNSKVGKACIFFDVKEKLLLNQNAVIIRTNNNEILRQKYLKYLIYNKSFGDYIIGCAQGSANQASITLNDIRSFRVEIPNIKIQDKIIAILDSIILKINLNNKINNNLYEFTNKLFQEKILKNPEKDNWKEYNLPEISKVINGYSYKGNELVNKSDIGMTTIKNFERTGGFKLDGFKDIIPKKCKIDHYVKPFEVLVACTDLTQNADIIGNAIMLLNNSDYKEVIMSMDLVKLVPTTKFVNNYMLYAIVNSKDFKDFALGYKSGTTVLHLNKNCFKEYTIKLPSEDLLRDLSKVIEINYKKISQVIEENKKLEQLRDTLLPKLMNGEIDLKNIEV